MKIRDLIYFDFEKASSLYSQIRGGLIQETRDASESSRDQRNIRKYDLKIFKPEFGGQSEERSSQLEVRVLHHDLLGKLEDYLFEETLAIDVNEAFAEGSSDAAQIREAIEGVPYLRVEGWASIEDYERMKAIGNQFNSLASFIGRCQLSNLEGLEDYRELEERLKQASRKAGREKDRNKKANAERQAAQMEQELRDKILELTKLGGLPDWLLEGIGLFIDVFMPQRLLLRIYPFETAPSFQVLANLKRSSFVENDLDHVLQAYGDRPNVKLTVLGLVTSLPEMGREPFDPMTEFQEGNELSDEASFESGFRGVFRGMEGFYRFVRYSRYPNVTVYPLAVYRTIRKGS